MRILRTVALSTLASTLASILTGIILNYALLLPLPFVIVICTLVFLTVFTFDPYFRSLRLEDRLNRVIDLINIVVSALIGARGKLFQLRRDKALTAGDLADVFDEATSGISESVALEYFKVLKGRSGGSSHEERRKGELLEKARRKEINYEEAEELRRLLEKQRKERERAGDTFGAIILGLLILFVLGILSALLAERKED